jgi:hypothetical protein
MLIHKITGLITIVVDWPRDLRAMTRQQRTPQLRMGSTATHLKTVDVLAVAYRLLNDPVLFTYWMASAQ